MTRFAARSLHTGVLIAAALTATPAIATPLVPIDPVVRVRDGDGSIPISSLPFNFPFGAFPDDPDETGTDCTVGAEPLGPVVTCVFRNVTGQPISRLDVIYGIPPDSGPLVFDIEDPDEFFDFKVIDESLARFAGGGIPSGFCGQGGVCAGGLFAVDLVGFPAGTTIEMTAQAAIPEPATLSLLALGLAAGLCRSRRRIQG